jgi:uncharacterized protein GlcG (DUF336 family)
MENSYIHSIQIAKDKAYTSASFSFSTQQWTSIFKTMPQIEQDFPNRDRLILFFGGSSIFEDGIKVGGIGVSDGIEEDILHAKYAIAQIGFE